MVIYSLIEKILVPIDGSQRSKKSLKYACWLSGAIGAKITVLHVIINPYTRKTAGFDVVGPLMSAGEKILEEAKRLVEGENCKNVNYELKQGVGNPSREIIKFSKQGGFSLIIMNARGHPPLTSVLMGSVSTMVVHYASCPVLILR